MNKTGSIAVWQTDRELFNALKKISHTGEITRIQPVSLGYYMVCRSAHRQGDKAKMEWALDKLVSRSSQISASHLYVANFCKSINTNYHNITDDYGMILLKAPQITT